MDNAPFVAAKRSSLLLFWIGSAAVTVGCPGAFAEFIAQAEINFVMAGMSAHDPLMVTKMAILLGLAMACYSLLPAKSTWNAPAPQEVVVESAAEDLNPAH